MHAQRDILSFIASRNIAVLATSDDTWGAVAAPVFYATTDGKELILKFRTDSAHAKTLASDARSGLAVYDHSSTYDHKAGVQVVGSCRRILELEAANAAIQLYCQAFLAARERFAPLPELISTEAQSGIYCFIVLEAKMVSPLGHDSMYQALIHSKAT